MKPILFSTPMVQAILDGRKTTTRRVVKLPKWLKIQPDGTVYGGSEHDFGLQPNIKAATDYWQITPYSPGDILWVRETWRSTGVIAEPYAYKANESELNLIGENGQLLTLRYKWRPSIFMPRAAARIFLRVTDVRVERLQDVTADDCRKEGVTPITYNCDPTDLSDYYKDAFHDLWDSINAKRGYGWDSGPWVWVIEFERCEKPEAAGA